MIRVKHKGNFNNIEQFFNRALKKDYLNIIAGHAERGLQALKEATPVSSGTTSDAWSYEIEDRDGVTKLTYLNDSINDGQNIVILLMYGHGTANGGYVEANDFVTPTLEPIFKDLAYAIWKEVTE